MGIRYSDSSFEHFDRESKAHEQARLYSLAQGAGAGSESVDNLVGTTRPEARGALAVAVINRDQSALHWLAAYHNIDLADALEQRAILARVREGRTAHQVYPSGKV